MTREEAIKWFKENPFYHKDHVPFNMAIEALEQEPCEDCIRKQTVLDMLEDIKAETDVVGYFYYEHYVDYIKGMPSITPQEPTRWIPVSEPPKEIGKYLVTIQYSTHKSIEVASYTNNLYEIDEYDFANDKRPGWYGYDSEYGFFEWQSIVAWMPLPPSYQGK